MEVEEIVTDKQINHAWGNANFGSVPKREVVRYALMKVACHYHNGHTAQMIIEELGLCTDKLKLTKKGREYFYEAFRNGTNH